MSEEMETVPIHAYRLVYPDSPHPPEMLWEWEQLPIDRLLWNATTFNREVVVWSKNPKLP
jgi:hypothetical protein